ncbi:hypothetical protein Tco_0670175 [Tanacetum coccineum]
MSPPVRRKYHNSVAIATGCKWFKKCKRINCKIRDPIAMWPCRVEEKMTLKEVDGQTVKEIETKIISKDGTITRVPGKFQDYETSEEESVERPRKRDLYGFVDHPQLQQEDPMNEFAPYRLPQQKGNMNGWLMEEEEEVERYEVDSDLESTASSKPVWEKANKDDHDRTTRNCPWCSKNEFAPHWLPQSSGNMNGWLVEDEDEVERNEVDSDLESTASSKPVWEKTTKADRDRASYHCPWCSK